MNTTLDNLQNRTNASSTTEARSLLWSLPRLFTSLSKAAEQQARETHERSSEQNVASFNYFISPYAGACMLMAIVLNRTVVFASSRRQSQRVTRSPKVILRLISLFWIISTFWDVLLQFAYIYPEMGKLLSNYLPDKRQSLDSLLWQVFVTLCISQFLETFVSITSAQEPTNDTGLTLFEHSLAFQECNFMEQPSPQLLLICVFSLVTQFTTHIVGLCNLKKFQLIPSTILGLSFIAFYSYAAFTDTLIYFPSIVVVSMIPQILVLLIISLCLLVYGLAVLITRDAANLTYTPMIKNLKDSLNLQLHDDFNSLLMRFGFIMFNAVENEEYVNEMSELNFTRGTYQDKNHLISGYFNKLDNNPEFQVQPKEKNHDGGYIGNNWSFLRKLMNVFKLCQFVFKLFTKLRTTSKRSNSNQESSRRNKSKTPDLHYSALFNDDRSLIDSDSEDYNPDSESDNEPLEYDSEVDDDQLDTEYIPTLAMARSRDAPTTNTSTLLPIVSSTTSSSHTEPRPRPIDELFSPNDVLQLITPTTLDDASYISTIRTHLLKDKRLTRSEYCAMNEDEVLREIILSKRPIQNHHDHEDTDHDNEDLNCVVCQTERRCVVLWPCKCFALCESCRLSLGVRGFAICVCCRGKVDGYSKVFMP